MSKRETLLVVALLVHPGCGEDENESKGALTATTCAVDETRLEGTVAGQMVALRHALVGGGFSQNNNGGELQTQTTQRGSSFHDASKIDVVIKWTGGFLEDAPTRPATGDTVLPSTAPAGLAGLKVCAGADSVVSMAGDDVRFLLRNLKSGPTCATAAAGELRGCWHNKTTQ